MDYFKKYTSNTVAACGVQSFFLMDPCEVRTSRTFYKISCGGKYNYSFLFSNNVDTTYSDGSFSVCNTVCNGWHLIEALVGVCSCDAIGEEISSPESAKKANESVFEMKHLSFNGAMSKKCTAGEIFCSDEISLDIKSGDYLCIQLSFTGNMFPYFEETLLPTYLKQNGKWVYSNKTPVVSMVGCDRAVKKRIAFLGDSITQGIGAGFNSYKNYCAVLSEKLGSAYAYHNLGIGFARANDAASNGFWLSKAKNNDIVFLCLGTNDILQQKSAKGLKADLAFIVSELKKNGIKIILQTVPPFDYEGEALDKWIEVNTFIKNELSKKADFFFDNVKVLGKSAREPQIAIFGGHPNAEGCARWAEALYAALPPELLE